MHIRKILIANRGEIALRIIRSARKMAIECGVIYTDSEKESEFVRESDEAFCLGSGPLLETYLNIPKLVKIARENGFDAIHPGYGFLSENSDFAQACRDAGILFIGPSPENIRLMSNKIESRKFVAYIGVPLIVSVSAETTEDLVQKASKLTFPLIVKAAAGGGGKGMRIVTNADNLFTSIEEAKREANAYFRDDSVYIEQYMESPRHIEIQLIADNFGNIVHLYDRECTIQRRYQKIIEEAPSSTLSPSIRASMIDAALQIARKMHYTSVGTIEFLIDSNQKFYFLEMNTRIQVEHTVTEEITGVDIVQEQICVAAEKLLSFNQDDIFAKGHAIECRIYAEDAFNQFMPSAGKILFYQEPPKRQVRIDSSMDAPIEVSMDFDPMIAKVIAHGSDRNDALKKLQASLKNYIIHGITTNLNYLQELMDMPDFIQNRLSTSFCEQSVKAIADSYQEKFKNIPLQNIVAGYLFSYLSGTDTGISNQTVWNSIGYWRNFMSFELDILGSVYKIRFRRLSFELIIFSINEDKEYKISASVAGTLVQIKTEGEPIEVYVTIAGNEIDVSISGLTFSISRLDSISLKQTNTINKSVFFSRNEVVAPLHGKVLKVNVKHGDRVQKGDVLMIIESMKMENNILAVRDGFVNLILVNIGDKVSSSELLITLKEVVLN